MVVAAFLSFVLIGALAGLFLLLRREIRHASTDTFARLTEMLRKAHGDRYSDPTAAAVVTSPSPAPVAIEPAPASEPRAIPLERVAKLDAATIEEIDDLAEVRGLTREQMLVELVHAGADEAERLAAGRPTPPGRGADEVVPPSGGRRR